MAQDDFAKLVELVTPEKREKIKRYRNHRDAQNTLIADILVRTEICKMTGLRNNQLEFSSNNFGKPYVTNCSHVHYNISHAGNSIVVALDDKPVGIDIELIKPIDLSVAERFFSPDEYEYIMSSVVDSRYRAFFEVWTKKESYIKWDGRGLSKPLPSFSVFERHHGQPHYHCVYEDEGAICNACSKQSESAELLTITSHELMGIIKHDQLCYQ